MGFKRRNGGVEIAGVSSTLISEFSALSSLLSEARFDLGPGQLAESQLELAEGDN